MSDRMSPTDADLAPPPPTAGTTTLAPQPDLFAMQRGEGDDEAGGAKKAAAAVVPAPPPNVSVGHRGAATPTFMSLDEGSWGDDIIAGTVIVPGQSMQPAADGSRRHNSYAANSGGNHTTVYIADGGNAATAGEENEQQQQQWDAITEKVQYSHKLRLLWVFEFVICIINGIGYPYHFIAFPLVFVGYYGARWFKFWACVCGVAFALAVVPITISDLAWRINKDDAMDDLERGVIVIIGLIAIVYHTWVGYQSYMLAMLVRYVTAEELRQLYEMPPVCGCL